MHSTQLLRSSNNTRDQQGCRETASAIQSWWECKMEQPLCRSTWQFPVKLNMQLPYHSAIALLGIYPREMETYVHTNTCMNVHSSFIHKIQKTVNNQMSFNGWLVKHVIHPCRGILLSNKNNFPYEQQLG